MQTTMMFDGNADDVSGPFFATGKDIKDGLTEYIKKVGFLIYKDYFMGIKLGKNTNIPAGIEKEHFLEIIRNVYVKRVKELEKGDLKKAA